MVVISYLNVNIIRALTCQVFASGGRPLHDKVAQRRAVFFRDLDVHVRLDAMDESTELSVGVASMDLEHRRQLSLLNDLTAAIRGGADDTLLYPLLQELVEHTNLHFLSEQLDMKLHAYEAYEAHLQEHQRLLLEVQNLRHSLATGTAADKNSLIEALRTWLVVHIQTADKALGEYLSQRGVALSSGEEP